jgi:hypothetical protein
MIGAFLELLELLIYFVTESENLMTGTQLILTHFEFVEFLGEKLIWQIRKSPLSSFNLILGDNAQGKTRFFNILKFLQSVHTGKPTISMPNLNTSIEMTFLDNEQKIIYKFNRLMRSDGVIPEFSEEIIREDKVIFSRSKNLLLEEISGNHVDNFFMPNNMPALLSINGEEFPTIAKLKSFFERMLFLDANRFTGNNIEVSKGALVLNSLGSNVSSVLDTWSTKIPEAFNEVVSEFRDCFSGFVDAVITKEDVFNGQLKVPFMFYKDKESEVEIRQNDWSDGMLRSIVLFVLVATRFPQYEDAFLRPSLICVDEIENGLDFSTLNKVISFYESYSNLVQIIVSSHSPTACNMVEPKYWHITKRKGIVVEIFSLEDKEPNLDDKRKKLLEDNWEFYKNHIAKSKLYIIK